jgi:hypothetical protein
MMLVLLISTVGTVVGFVILVLALLSGKPK